MKYIAMSSGFVGVLVLLIVSPVMAGWDYVREVDPINDVVKQSVVSSESRGNGSLAISCINFPGGKIDYSISVKLGEMVTLKPKGHAEVLTRIDKAEAVKHNWFAVEGSQTIYSLGSQKAHFEKMVRGKHLVIRVSDPSVPSG